MKPFLKWAGNKYQIVDHIRQSLTTGKRLIEPFVGSGAVFLNTDYPHYLLSDSNADLICLYDFIKQAGGSFIAYCQSFFSASNNNEEKFYELRAQFNNTKDKQLKSALFLYLNKHCFNGLCRYNKKNEFNAPFGRYKQPYFPEKEMHYFLKKSENAIFQCADFLTTMQTASPGDVIYCDPPYVPLSKTANFTKFNAAGFDESQQLLLAKTAKELAEKGVMVVISNHDTEFTRELYEPAKISSLKVQRYISCNSSSRVKANELLAVFD